LPAFTLDQNGFDAAFDLAMHFDPDLRDLEEGAIGHDLDPA